MRIRFFLGFVSTSLVAAGFGIQACGGTSDDTASGTDAAPEAKADTGLLDSSAPDVFDARPPCDPTKDLLKDIPDASIADGASTTGACFACANAKCSREISDCQKDCSRSTTDLGCQDIAGKALECYAKTQNIFTCAGSLASVPNPTRSIGIALGACVSQSCEKECGVPSDGGTDGGADADAN
jgi:hypothetical protein